MQRKLPPAGAKSERGNSGSITLSGLGRPSWCMFCHHACLQGWEDPLLQPGLPRRGPVSNFQVYISSVICICALTSRVFGSAVGTRAICGMGILCLGISIVGWRHLGALEVPSVSNLSSNGKASLVGREFCWAEFCCCLF